MKTEKWEHSTCKDYVLTEHDLTEPYSHSQYP